MREDMNIIVLCHSENAGTVDSPKLKIKTVGKLLDNLITVEGLFTFVLFTNVSTDAEGNTTYSFITKSDGTTTAKTPTECFDTKLIPNDLQFVIDKIAEFNA